LDQHYNSLGRGRAQPFEERVLQHEHIDKLLFVLLGKGLD